MVVARDKEGTADIASRFGVATDSADLTETTTAQSVLHDVRPSVLILNAGATAPMAPIHEQTWDGFSVAWDNDVRAGFHWIQAAIRLPAEFSRRPAADYWGRSILHTVGMTVSFPSIRRSSFQPIPL
jgi:NAD(P)-dependent dehydrogenase (short-subunit alcohol dehydrogenase family)